MMYKIDLNTSSQKWTKNEYRYIYYKIKFKA